MAWRRIGDKLLSEPMLTRFTDAYVALRGDDGKSVGKESDAVSFRFIDYNALLICHSMCTRYPCFIDTMYHIFLLNSYQSGLLQVVIVGLVDLSNTCFYSNRYFNLLLQSR